MLNKKLNPKVPKNKNVVTSLQIWYCLKYNIYQYWNKYEGQKPQDKERIKVKLERGYNLQLDCQSGDDAGRGVDPGDGGHLQVGLNEHT